MTMASNLRNIDEAVQYLSRIVSSQRQSDRPDFDRLVDAYLETRRTLAKEFRDLASRTLVGPTPQLELVKRDIVKEMRSRYGHLVPQQHLAVRGYLAVHSVLLEYLVNNAGRPVPASRLRVLTGDQIHTERRVRDLRDLGLTVTARKALGEDQYVLENPEGDAQLGARLQLARNIRADKSLSTADRALLLRDLS